MHDFPLRKFSLEPFRSLDLLQGDAFEVMIAEELPDELAEIVGQSLRVEAFLLAVRLH